MKVDALCCRSFQEQPSVVVLGFYFAFLFERTRHPVQYLCNVCSQVWRVQGATTPKNIRSIHRAAETRSRDICNGRSLSTVNLFRSESTAVPFNVRLVTLMHGAGGGGIGALHPWGLKTKQIQSS